MNVVLNYSGIPNVAFNQRKLLRNFTEYLEKTDSVYIIPVKALDSLQRLHLSLIAEKVSYANAAINELNLHLPNKYVHQSLIELDSDKIRLALATNLRRLLRPRNKDFIFFGSLSRIDSQTNQFRKHWNWDALNYHGFDAKNKQVAVIGNDYEFDSYKDSTNKLNPFEYKIYYYSDLQDFIRKRYEPIDFVTEDWLSENVDFEMSYRQLKNSQNREIYDMLNGTSELTAKNANYTYHITQIQPIDRNFTVHDMHDQKLLVTIVDIAEIETTKTTLHGISSHTGRSHNKCTNHFMAKIEFLIILDDKKLVFQDVIQFQMIDQA